MGKSLAKKLSNLRSYGAAGAGALSLQVCTRILLWSLELALLVLRPATFFWVAIAILSTSHVNYLARSTLANVPTDDGSGTSGQRA